VKLMWTSTVQGLNCSCYRVQTFP